jgi:RNA polymerase sigma-70 factor (ECF subfamily)
MKEKVDLELLKDVIKKLKGGDESAMGTFYDLTYRSIYRFSFFLSKDENAAYDLCHDTFIKAFLSIRELKDEGAALGWLFRVAKNTFLDQKKKKSEEHITEQIERTLFKNQDIENLLTIKKVLTSFHKEDQVVLLLVDMEGLSYKEASQATGLSEDSIRMKLHRIRQEFIQKFDSGETN